MGPGFGMAVAAHCTALRILGWIAVVGVISSLVWIGVGVYWLIMHMRIV